MFSKSSCSSVTTTDVCNRRSLFFKSSNGFYRILYIDSELIRNLPRLSEVYDITLKELGAALSQVELGFHKINNQNHVSVHGEEVCRDRDNTTTISAIPSFKCLLVDE